MAGMWVAFFILGSWFSVIFLALTRINLEGLESIAKYSWLIVLIQFLHMGLFITVHDACHGTVVPGHKRINQWFGRVFALLYAGFSFDLLARKHRDHHFHSGTLLDPDFHRKNHSSFWLWLFSFLNEYVSVKQILIMSLAAQVLMHGFKLPEINVLVFWVLPSVLSSIQLFYFGTFLPHRKVSSNEFEDHHHTRNFSIPKILSLLSCYHFGAFHHTHHQRPQVPWFRLPCAAKEIILQFNIHRHLEK